MSNGARHTWGFFAGLVLTAALGALLIFGTYRLQHGYVTQFHKQDKWIGGGLIAAAAIVFALMAASRLSPVASLIGGIVFTAAGAVFFISQKTTADLINQFPFKEQRVTLAGLEDEGFILFAGVGLLFASFFPSRWRARVDDDDAAGYEYGVPSSADPYGTDPVFGNESSTSGRHASRGDRTATYPHDQSVYGGDQTAPAYGNDRAAYDQTSYDQTAYGGSAGYDAASPYEQQPYSGRAPFNPPGEDGGTREMRRD
jgi:hypothetical protein